MKKSVVDIKPVGDGRAVLKYPAPYVYRVAISDKRIVSTDGLSLIRIRFALIVKKSERLTTPAATASDFVAASRGQKLRSQASSLCG